MDKLTRALVFLAAGLALACAQSAQSGTEDDAVFELQVTGHAGRGESGSLLTTQLYAEKPLPVRDVSVFLVVNRDQEFRAVYAGVARKFGELQLGVGFGNAWYDGIRHPTVNPWLFYASDDVEAYLTAEHYARDDQAPWFYKGHAGKRITDSFFVGAYGEKDVGVGPMIGWRNGSLRIWAAVPVVSRPERGARGVAGVQVEF
ncbi:MAG: hypothetical protein Q8L56_03370 [Rhodocyclaceae bacterium]|nr:hypothetical protein [Rhodocyclaceae bacterium]